MATTGLTESVSRGTDVMYQASVANVTTAIGENFTFPTGMFEIVSVSVQISNTGSPAVTLQDYPGIVQWLTTGGSVVAAMRQLDAVSYETGASWANFEPIGDSVMAEGDFLKYRNVDLEAGSTLDINFYVRTKVLR